MNKKAGVQISSLFVIAIVLFVMFGTQLFSLFKNPVAIIIALVVFFALNR